MLIVPEACCALCCSALTATIDGEGLGVVFATLACTVHVHCGIQLSNVWL